METREKMLNKHIDLQNIQQDTISARCIRTHLQHM